MDVCISAIGTATPAFSQPQSKVYELISDRLNLSKLEKRILKSFYRDSGIDHRYSVLEDFIKINDHFPSTQTRMQIYKENALNLALSAIEQCLILSPNFDLQHITHLITVSCTGMYAPGLDIEIAQKLKLSSSIQRTCINFMGCYGVFNALKMATHICKADANAKVLIISVEMCTLHFQNNFTQDNIIASTIFSDGAGALLIESQSDTLGFQLNHFYCDLMPKSEKEMTWEIGDQGFDIRLSSYVPELIENGIAAFTQKLLLQKTLELNNVDYYAIHPGGKKILEACETALNITTEDNRFSYETLRQYGNMSSATVIFVLKKIWEQVKKNDHHKKILSCAFGPGLTLESMLLTIKHP